MNSDGNTDSEDDVEDPRRYRSTTMDERYAIFLTVRTTMVDGRVKNGIHSELAKQLGLSRVTISRQWATMRDKLAPLLITQPVVMHPEIIRNNHALLFGDGKSSRKRGKYKYDRDEVDAAIKAVPVKMRRSVRKVAMRIGMAKSTVNQYVHPRYPGEEPLLHRAISKLKPTLTDKNKEERYTFALDQINMATAHLLRPRFLDMMDRVHIDEKWFHMCQDGEGYLLCSDEEPPERHVKHKGYIGKVMFLCAQARPRWDFHRAMQWCMERLDCGQLASTP
jgi:DNA-binding transcriptional regulator YdaS (Cro superfamily)